MAAWKTYQEIMVILVNLSIDVKNMERCSVGKMTAEQKVQYLELLTQMKTYDNVIRMLERNKE